MRRRWRDMTSAFGFLTIVPVGQEWPADEPPDGLPFYPWVGWLIGAAGVGIVLGLEAIGVSIVRNAWLVGVLVVGGWALLTRFLHWDGLADAADGLLGGSDRDEKLEIMRDSRVGAFGVIAIVLVAAAQVAAIGSLATIGAWWPILAAPVTGRAAVTLAAWSLPAARTDGLGLTVNTLHVPLSSRAIAAGGVLALLAPVAADTLLGPAGWTLPQMALVIVVADVVALAAPRVLARPVGGMTGDLYGATVILVETTMLALAALVV